MDQRKKERLILLIAIVVLLGMFGGLMMVINNLTKELKNVLAMNKELVESIALSQEKSILESEVLEFTLPPLIADDKNPFPIEEECYVTSPFGTRENPFILDERGSIYGGSETGFHIGLDISSHVYRPEIHSCTDGVVVTHYPAPDGYYRGHDVYGGLVVVQDKDGRLWYYAHMSLTSVHEGMKVKVGDSLGRMGSTGMSTNDHLHIGVMDHGEWVNPLEVLSYYYVEKNGRIEK